ncbi:MAG: tetratricopeptide repeat protein [Gammaproteobacteria bacterium]|nr:tetratricopeptide repeat protein [Gammaproteobacteria bacterium]MBU1775255.1 tetratricopeptide repeat protein [Gammaproteobacteria bacterium]MBU1968474.1 tetratricopeptide repeat protein [Gammaproteobacteria bacterium]
MNKMKKTGCIVALCAFLSISPAVHADDIQDANKLFKQGLHAQAMEKVDAVLAGKPKDAQARFLKGLIQTEQGDASAAIKTFTELTDDYPELPEPYNNLAVLYASKGEYEKAKIALEMAIRTHPSYATAHENLGDIYAKMASQAYDRALQLDKSNTSTQTKLAMIRDLFGGNAKSSRSTKPVIAALAEPAPVAPPAQVAVAKLPAPKKPEPVPAPVAKPDADTELLKVTQAWAAAWSAKDYRKYLTFYAAAFKTPGGMSRKAWEAQRQQRISAPKSIKVEVLDAKVKVADDSHASVTFKQIYRASHLNSTSAKTLVWVKQDGQWLIAEERSGN